MAFLRKLKGKIGAFLRRKGSKAYFWNLRQKCNTCRFYLLRRYYIGRYQRLMERNGADIALGCEFAEVPVFPHGFYGIFMSEGAKIGKNCVIFHQVTIGSNTIPGSPGRGCPTIGDNVYIGCGAKIIGGVRVGNNVRIGANCVVTRDVPDNATVVLQSPRVIVKDTPQNNEFVSYHQMAREGK
jgi:serine O-acetyltransferase